MTTPRIQSYKSFSKIAFSPIPKSCLSSRDSIRFGIKRLCTSILTDYIYIICLFGNLYSLENCMAFLDKELLVGCRRIDSEAITDICFIDYFGEYKVSRCLLTIHSNKIYQVLILLSSQKLSLLNIKSKYRFTIESNES